MDTRDLKVFVVVYETKSITRAAKDQFLSPQGCSKIVQKIEAELGTSLFARNHFGVKPTPQGDALYRRAQMVIRLLEGVKDEVEAARALKYTLTIASTQGVSEYLSLAFIRDFAESHPHISPRIMESPDAIAKQRTLDNVAEIGVLGGPVDLSVFHAVPFTSHRPCLVVNEANPLARKAAIDYADLDCQPLAMVSREFASHHLVVNRLANAGVHVDIVMEATELDLCHRLAEQGDAIAVSFDFAAWGGRRAHTVIRPFADRSFVWETFIVRKAGADLSPQAQEFCDFALAWVADHRADLFQWPGA